MRQELALAGLAAVLLAAAFISGCVGEPDGSLPPPVDFIPEVTAGAEDELIIRYYPNSTEPAPYSITFEIEVDGETTDAVAGRIVSDVSAADPIELPPVRTAPGAEVSVRVTIYDEFRRAVHRDTTTVIVGNEIQVTVR
ncbi:hypothetical protein E2N92_06640 [Methanofollis formosanus]|uniref:Uncharacterized protein n=1 Tax=Methanofollis formosanus TaxID=299308 RepID=A0A8G1A150_9EURY|nr:hypothetical protein [Methanofollis formosanus]QYZ79130.1 hypothetical protein E2N92_06640 [Methanofollis formosanus]